MNLSTNEIQELLDKHQEELLKKMQKTLKESISIEVNPLKAEVMKVSNDLNNLRESVSNNLNKVREEIKETRNKLANFADRMDLYEAGQRIQSAARRETTGRLKESSMGPSEPHPSGDSAVDLPLRWRRSYAPT